MAYYDNTDGNTHYVQDNGELGFAIWGYGKTNTPFLTITSRPTMQLDLFVNIAIKCNQIICFCVMLASTYV